MIKSTDIICVKKFAKDFASHLKKELCGRTGYRFDCIANGSTSCVGSKSCYVEIYNLEDSVKLDYSIGKIKISDHFNKGYADWNLDITGMDLLSVKAKEYSIQCANEFMKEFEVV